MVCRGRVATTSFSFSVSACIRNYDVRRISNIHQLGILQRRRTPNKNKIWSKFIKKLIITIQRRKQSNTVEAVQWLVTYLATFMYFAAASYWWISTVSIREKFFCSLASTAGAWNFECKKIRSNKWVTEDIVMKNIWSSAHVIKTDR
jgi:hypothetical protein